MTHPTPLPPPLSALWDWQLQGACRGTDSDAFFHPPGERSARRRQRIERAKAVCADCPVRTACRQHALDAIEPYGIWGGLSEEERAELLGVATLRDAPRRRLLRVERAKGGRSPVILPG